MVGSLTAWCTCSTGWPEDVARIGRRELQDFFATHYTPKRLTIAIVGDVIPEKVCLR